MNNPEEAEKIKKLISNNIFIAIYIACAAVGI